MDRKQEGLDPPGRNSVILERDMESWGRRRARRRKRRNEEGRFPLITLMLFRGKGWNVIPDITFLIIIIKMCEEKRRSVILE